MAKLTKAAAKRKHGSYYRIAQICDIYPSAVTRWGKYVPKGRVKVLEETEGRKK